MKTKYKPYGFDEKYEFRTYKNIGRDYGDRKIADMGLVGNIKRFFRKKMNRKQKKYTMCDTYLQWREHVDKNIEKYALDNENYKHWIVKQKRFYAGRLEATKIILIPLYVFVLTVLVGSEQNNIIQIITVTIIAEIVMCILVMKDTEWKSFYKDYIEILEAKIGSKEDEEVENFKGKI
ncbi:hypothetical protein [Eshraghiella crossota]|uniref:hypothetical protein n=1 Tax=Eshraghiella crossota TaxID=45851 RepID=UPI003F8130BB